MTRIACALRLQLQDEIMDRLIVVVQSDHPLTRADQHVPIPILEDR